MSRKKCESLEELARIYELLNIIVGIAFLISGVTKEKFFMKIEWQFYDDFWKKRGGFRTSSYLANICYDYFRKFS